jgi:hypothetical protein
MAPQYNQERSTCSRPKIPTKNAPQKNAESLTLQGGSGSVSGSASPFGYAFAITFAVVADYMWYYVADYMWYYDEAVGTARSATFTPVFAYGRQAYINSHTACATIDTQEHSGSSQATPPSGSRGATWRRSVTEAAAFLNLDRCDGGMTTDTGYPTFGSTSGYSVSSDP